MNKNSEKAEAKKSAIVEAALELFFERGYEGTSIRMIQKKIGKEVGLFYYYFESKDAVFEAAIELFFVSYEKGMKEIVEAGRVNPKRELSKYIEYMHEATQDFRGKYLGKLHWSILGAIREHTMFIMKKYIGEILDNYLKKEIITEPVMGRDVVVNLLAYGIGGSILYQDGKTYEEQEKSLKCLIPMLLGASEEL